MIPKRIIVVSHTLPFAYECLENPLTPPSAAHDDIHDNPINTPPFSTVHYATPQDPISSAHEPCISPPGCPIKFHDRTHQTSFAIGDNVHPSTSLLYIGKPSSLLLLNGNVNNGGSRRNSNSGSNSEDLHAINNQKPFPSEIAKEYREQKQSIAILIDDSKVENGHYDGYCRTILNPLMHYVLWESSLDKSQSEFWEDYCKVNRKFSEAILNEWQPGDLVLVLDYHLLMVPAMLREQNPDIQSCLYLKSPFPTSEVFRCLPQAKQVLQGMLGATCIGFQTHSYSRHFLSSCTRILGLECTPKGASLDTRFVNVIVQPIGINPSYLKEQFHSQSTKTKLESFKEKFTGQRLIVGVETAENTRGIIHKLLGIERLFQMFPQFVGSITLLQVIFPHPPASETASFDARINEIASRINGQFGTLNYTPINIHHQSIQNEEYIALLSLADILLQSSERDSVSAIVLEFIAVQEEESVGICIISEFIGLASVIPGTILINPWDHDGVALAIHRALLMDKGERMSLYENGHRFIHSHSVRHWSSALISSIKFSENFADETNGGGLGNLYLGGGDDDQRIKKLNFETVLDAYLGGGMSLISEDSCSSAGTNSSLERPSFESPQQSAVQQQQRLIMLDYDGTLVGIRRTPSAAVPTQELIRCLRTLTMDPKNYVYIISGRPADFLEQVLGGIPRLGMSAEHGSFFKPIRGGTTDATPSTWQSSIDQAEIGEWMPQVEKIMDYYVERTLNSMIEHKKASITWHYRMSDPEFGQWQSKELLHHLQQTLAPHYPIEIFSGKRNIEVRSGACNKGEIVKMLLERHKDASFVFCAGDDRTDEDMFKACDLSGRVAGEGDSRVNGGLYTCMVGYDQSKSTLAKYFVDGPEQIVSILFRLSNCLGDRSNVHTL